MPRGRRVNEVEVSKPGLDLGGIDMNQISGLLQNVDMNQISGLLKNVDMNQISGLLKNIDISQLLSMVSSIGGVGGIGNILGGLSGIGGNSQQSNSVERGAARHYSGDRRLEVLYALKPMVTPERANLIDMILQIYTISKILKR
jgi:hypothetical protein